MKKITEEVCNWLTSPVSCSIIILLLSLTGCINHGNNADSSKSVEQIRQEFLNPPDECRPETFWVWMGGLISKKGITSDLESMAKAGIGGVMVMQMPDQCPYPNRWSYRDYPGKVRCLSDDWFGMINYAIGECDRLGLYFSIFMCPGWSHCGAPWVTPAKGIKNLVAGDTLIIGPAIFNGIIPKAPPLQGVEGGNRIPAWSDDFNQNQNTLKPFYKDELILAFPARGEGQALVSHEIIDITEKMSPEGKLVWKVPQGSWKIVRLGIASENGRNHPAPVEGSGPECDRMDPDAVKLVFDGIAGRIQREARAKGYRSFKRFETDSYESGIQDFGMDFRKEFKKRRGYDCSLWLPAWVDKGVVIESADQTRRFRNDMQRTISELWTERFHETLRRLGDDNDLDWLIEPYFKLKIDWRTSGARSRYPGNEFWAKGSVMGEKGTMGPAPGIAALYDLDMVWAEAFTAEPDQSAWRNDPWLLKPYGDRAFCEGINHFIMHAFVHNPFDDRYQPGLTMGYWGTQFSRHLTWWPLSSGWHRYLARCQYMLRQGQPVIDVLHYPQKKEHIPKEFGYAGPYRQVTLNDETLMDRLSVEDGQIVLPNGNSFSALVLNPEMPLRPEALEKILQLVRDGAVLIGDPPPALSPSLENYPEADRQLKKMIEELWKEKRTGKGKVLTGKSAGGYLDDLLGGPGFLCPANPADSISVRAMHRRIGRTDFWFVAFSGERELETELRFRVTGKVPEWWDPVTGKTRMLPEYRQEGIYTVVPFRFFPRQGGFMVFERDAEHTGPFHTGNNHPGEQVLMPIDSPWEVSFDPEWGGPVGPVRFDELADWTERPEKGIRYYSGIAMYETRFDMPGIRNPQEDKKTWLSLGRVKNVARVSLNGKDLGTAWCAPWRVEVPAELIKEKDNRLQVHVANTWVNRLIGDEQEPEDCELAGPDLWFSSMQEQGVRMAGYNKETIGRGLKDLPDWLLDDLPRPSRGRYTFTSWRYYDKSAPLYPSGLLGPVIIIQENP